VSKVKEGAVLQPAISRRSQSRNMHSKDTLLSISGSHALELRAMVILCPCGFRLNTHSDSLTLKDFENMLMSVLAAHR
jgi:hypothetical protein